jgi:hypothetical protein
VPHHQSQNFIGFVEAAELACVRHLAAEDLRVVFARHYGFRARDEGGEEPIERLDSIAMPPLQLLRKAPRRSSFSSVGGSF